MASQVEALPPAVYGYNANIKWQYIVAGNKTRRAKVVSAGILSDCRYK
jgi:hypothetical protein